MAAVRVESKAFTDSRIKLLAKNLNTDWHYVLGVMTDLWRECTEEGVYELREDSIDAMAGRELFAQEMIKVGLGKKSSGKVYISGARGKIDWLKKMRENGKKGGRPKLALLKN
jgi:hypothetical protein